MMLDTEELASAVDLHIMLPKIQKENHSIPSINNIRPTKFYRTMY
jgi:hypothetical protein